MEIWDEKHSGINQYGKMEDRFTAIGWVEDVLYVCYTVREHGNEEFIRMISARVAMPAEKNYSSVGCGIEDHECSHGIERM